MIGTKIQPSDCNGLSFLSFSLYIYDVCVCMCVVVVGFSLIFSFPFFPSHKIFPSHKKDLRNHLEASLKRLQTSYVDYYLIHWPVNAKTLEGYKEGETLQRIFRELEELKSEGKIHHIGGSFIQFHFRFPFYFWF